MTVDTLQKEFELAVAGQKFTTKDIWNVVVVASPRVRQSRAQRISWTMRLAPVPAILILAKQ